MPDSTTANPETERKRAVRREAFALKNERRKIGKQNGTRKERQEAKAFRRMVHGAFGKDTGSFAHRCAIGTTSNRTNHVPETGGENL